MNKDIDRAERARRILDDSLVKEARAAIEATLTEIVMDAPLEDRERREQALAMYKAAQSFFQAFEIAVAGGEIAKADMLNAENLKARAEANRRMIYGVA